MKKLTIDEAGALVTDIIKNDKVHQDYDRVNDIADKMMRLITGENMKPLMRKFDRRESKEMFDQRVDITQHITSTVCRSLIEPEYKIPRSNGVRRILKYSDDNENQKLKELESILSTFWGDKSLDKYLNTRWIDLTNLDPNSFIVYEWGEFDNRTERAKPYPFEVSSEEAVYYEYDNNILQFLVVKNEFVSGAGGRQEKVYGAEGNVRKRYTIYFVGHSIVFDELTDEQAKKVKPAPRRDEWTQGQEYVLLKDKVYRVQVFDSRLNFIPAERVGFRYDPSTRGRTCLPSIWAAVPILMKTIKANSELDLTMSLHAHPQKIQYVRKCQAENCNDGRLPGGGTCKVCGGTGREKVQTSAQEYIELVMPRDKEDMVALDNIVRYVYPPVDLVKFQDEYIKSLTAQCKEAIYNSEIFSRQQIAETATGKNIDLQNVYDALYPMAEAYSHIWGSSIKAIASITDKYENLVYAYIFSKDFKMKSMSELIMDLKTAADSRADGFVKQGIQDDIAQIMYTDNPKAYARYKTKERFNPYSGKSREEVAMIVSLAPQTDFYRILWEMYGYVFEELEREFMKKGVDFYDMTYDKQWKAIEKKVNAKIEERKVMQPGIKLEGDDE